MAKILKRSLLIVFVILTILAVKVLYDVSLTPVPFSISSKYEKVIARNSKKTLVPNETTEISNANYADLTKATAGFDKTVQNSLVGELIIPKSNIDLPILSYASNQTLSTGAAQYYPERIIGRGNYVLASHNFYGADVLLARISLLKNNDIIYVRNSQYIFKFEVTTNKIIDETEIDYLNQTDQAIITLIRCEGGENTTKRRIVLGKLVSTNKINNNSKKTQTATIAKLPKADFGKTDFYHQVLTRFSNVAWVRTSSDILALWLNGEELTLLIEVVIVWLLIVVVLIKFGGWI